jgi:hypothetical protein
MFFSEIGSGGSIWSFCLIVYTLNENAGIGPNRVNVEQYGLAGPICGREDHRRVTS